MATELLDRILGFGNLMLAWDRVAQNRGVPGADGVSLKRFGRGAQAQLLRLADDVRAADYRSGPLRRLTIRQPNGKARRVTVFTVRDRVIQRAALNVLEPLLDRQFHRCSFGYRSGRSVQQAIARIVTLRDRGLDWVVDADVRDCFASLDHDLLEQRVERTIPDPAVVALLKLWITAGAAGERRGIALGAPMSPLLCNLYLHQLDTGLVKRRFQPVRYADDFVVLCRSREHGEWALRATQKVLRGLRLELHPQKSSLRTFDQGFSFLGATFRGTDYHYLYDGKRIVVDQLPPTDFHNHLDGYV